MSEHHLTIEHLTTEELTRIFSKIKVSTEHCYNGSPCWDWTAGKFKGGYGQIKYKDYPQLAHRLLYAWLVAPLPTRASGIKLDLDHKCNRPVCCNPAHLILTTPRANILRSNNGAARNARKTHCKRGHELSGDNLRINVDGQRQCRECQNRGLRDRTRARYARDAAFRDKLRRQACEFDKAKRAIDPEWTEKKRAYGREYMRQKRARLKASAQSD